MNDDFNFLDSEDDGAFIKGVRAVGPSFILFISAALSISFYVTAGSAVFGWMPQEWMMITSAIILGLTGNELAVSFWLNVRTRAKNLTNEQGSIVQTGIVLGWLTSMCTTLAAFIVTPETSPAFLERYADVIAFVTMTIPIIIQTSLVIGFLAFSRDAAVATQQAKNWGDSLSVWSKIYRAMNKTALEEAKQEAKRQLPEYATTRGQHSASEAVRRALAPIFAEQNPRSNDEVVTMSFDATPPAEAQQERGYDVQYASGGLWRTHKPDCTRLEALELAQDIAQKGTKSRIMLNGQVWTAYTPGPGMVQGNGLPS